MTGWEQLHETHDIERVRSQIVVEELNDSGVAVPTIGRIVVYRSRTNKYDLPAVVNCTRATLNPEGVEGGHIPDLDDDLHVHITVMSPGPSGLRADATDFVTESPHGRHENQGGTYTEWNIGYDPNGAPGTWRWPQIR